ncbi:MAG: hypothetical protein ACYCT0_04645 [Sulfobacillus sp.]
MHLISPGEYVLTEAKSTVVCQVLKSHPHALYVEEVLSRRRYITGLAEVIRLTPTETARLLLQHWTLSVLHPVSSYRGHYR